MRTDEMDDIHQAKIMIEMALTIRKMKIKGQGIIMVKGVTISQQCYPL